MANFFDSPRLTFVRAQHHIRDFNDTINRFRADEPWSYFVDTESQSRQDLHKIQFTKQLPKFLSCFLFDAANNLRSVLDQAGYAAALAGRSTNLKRTNFPFADTLEELNINIDGQRKICKHLPPEITALFRGFNPYKGGNAPLWALSKLCNAKKHCALVPLAVESPSATFVTEIDPRRLGWLP